MRPNGPTYWLLNGRQNWRSAHACQVSAGAASGLRLRASADGPLSFSAPAGCLGGLALPRGIARDPSGTLYLLDEDLATGGARIKRFEQDSASFQPLPTLGEFGEGPRELCRPRNIACAGSNLYVVDWGNRRVQVFDLHTLALRHIWEPALTFQLGDILDPRRLAVRLLYEERAISAYLRSQLSSSLIAQLTFHATAQTLPLWLQTALVDELNRLLLGESLYQKEHFADVSLSTGTLDLAGQKPSGKMKVYLNALLLEEAYPDVIRQERWEPYDVATHVDRAYILDRRRGRVYTHVVGSDYLAILIEGVGKADRWQRIAVDRQGRIYLLRRDEEVEPRGSVPGTESLAGCDVFDMEGHYLEFVDEPDEVRDRFEPVEVVMDAQGRFCLAARWIGPLDLRRKDIQNPAHLLARLRHAQDEVSKYVRQHLSKTSRGLLEKYNGTEPPGEELLRSIVADLNRLIRRQESIYHPVRFAGVALAPATRELQRLSPRGDTLVLLNRWLLEGAYPGVLARTGGGRLIGKQAGLPSPTPLEPLRLYAEMPYNSLLFDKMGNPLTSLPAADEPGPSRPPYQRHGEWCSEALDSELYQCQWHRVELMVSSLPVGTQLTVETYVDERVLTAEEVAEVPCERWDAGHIIANRELPSRPADQSNPVLQPYEFLVQSRKGRYLWLRVRFAGDGYDTPVIQEIRVHYPRSSYLEYLPAVFSADEETHWFLERFLSIFQAEWDLLEHRIETIRRYFDPKAVPDDHLAELARWLAVRLEGDWTPEQNRKLVEAAPELIGRRGTPEGLRRLLQVYLQNITGITPEQQQAYPILVEGYRERERLLLSISSGATLGQDAPLWSPSVVGRLQLDVFAQEGKVRLVSTGDPERDVFHAFAHRFRVFMPAAWMRTTDDERLVRSVLETEKPAHTDYELCLVRPRIRVGWQATLGLDTIIGDFPKARLNCADEDADKVPPALPPSRLGYDTVLAAGPARPQGLHLAPGAYVGHDTVLH